MRNWAAENPRTWRTENARTWATESPKIWTTEDPPLFTQINIELQSDCNRNCFFCPRSGDFFSGKRKNPDGSNVKKSMPTSEVLRIMDQAVELGHRGRIAFRHLSESFLDPRIIDMAREARKRGLVPVEATNGDVLRHRPDMCKEVAQLYESICVGIYDITNENEVEAEKEFWRKQLAGTEVCFSQIKDVGWRSHVKYDTRMVNTPKAFPCSQCFDPLRVMMIHYNGDIALCCQDMLNEFSLGNAFETHIKDIWFSERHVEIVNDLANGHRHKYQLCSQCPCYPPYMEKKVFTVQEKPTENGTETKIITERSYNSLNEIINQMHNKKMVIWGTGQVYKSTYANLIKDNGNKCNMVGFIDNNSANWGKEIDGYNVFSPDALNDMAVDTVIIASTYKEEIMCQIFEMDLLGIDVVT